jgi:surface-anchored protein
MRASRLLAPGARALACLPVLLFTFSACGDDDPPAGPEGHGGQGGATSSSTGEPSTTGSGGGGGSAAEGAGGQGGGGGGPPVAVCGDGILQEPEACDDGAAASGDGCDAGCGVEYILDSGHIDVFEITYDEATDQLATRVKDTTDLYALTKVFRAPAEVVVDVNEALAALEVPADLPPEFAFLGPPGTTFFLLDQVQQEGLPWPGWSTERLLDSLPLGMTLPDVPDPLKLAIDVQGPGDVFAFQVDGNGLPVSKYIDTVDPAPDVIPMHPSTHIHTAWAFTEAGDYTLTATPELQTSRGTIAGPAEAFRFHIGAPLIAKADAPMVTVEGGGPVVYSVGDPVHLEAVLSPPLNPARFDWYRWVESYDLVPGEHAATIDFIADAPVEALYSAALISISTARVLSVGTTSVTVQ